MTERIQRALDNELRRRLLTPDEAAELEACEQMIQDTVEQVSPAMVPDLAPGVMERIRARSASKSVVPRGRRRARQWLAWVWSPRPLVIRPAYVVAAILLMLGAAYFGAEAPAPDQTTLAADAPRVFVQFRIEAPAASEVRLAGDFTNWQPAYALHETRAGVWLAIVPLEPGIHYYAFVVDGAHWVPDPHATQVDDGFGGVNSRLAVLLPE